MLRLHRTMQMKVETTFIQGEYLKNDNSEGSDENFEEYGELEIDLDYNDNDQPLDLSMKHKSNNHNLTVKETKLPTCDINFSKFDNNNVTTNQNDNTVKFMTELEVTKLLEPYVKSVHKKFSCTVCDMKFGSKVKAVTHVENKHVDCLQYKCPLCRASKGTRLAYESHLRRGHGARVMDYHPVIRSKKIFSVKSEALIGHREPQSGQPYDLQFVTFLRQRLCSGKQSLETSVEWIKQEHGIFKINNRHQFATAWYRFKGNELGTWDTLYKSVIKEFIDRNIFKQISSDDPVFQVFCIKQLLQ
eukprot:TRINITY_DN6181_c1_g1_i14.p1 TRINITY_DN6181_c1_g1~~TRINITY_DN6181_c1_g1_i14.p1  ORF type:complete len:302 (-),score=67.74 TRINITY_DN6181_c1_g1_i14:18-923(-)